MTIYYDADVNMSYMYITPIRVKYIDSEDSTVLYASIADNLSNRATVQYQLRGSSEAIYLTGTAYITGDNYSSWIGDSEYVFTYLMELLSLTELSLPEEGT